MAVFSINRNACAIHVRCVVIYLLINNFRSFLSFRIVSHEKRKKKWHYVHVIDTLPANCAGSDMILLCFFSLSLPLSSSSSAIWFFDSFYKYLRIQMNYCYNERLPTWRWFRKNKNNIIIIEHERKTTENTNGWTLWMRRNREIATPSPTS